MFDVKAVLAEIAKPRLTGSEGAAEVTAAVRQQFEDLGYGVQEREFHFNPWPGRIGISVAGGLYLVATVAAAMFLHAGNAFGAIALLLILLVVVGAIALFSGALIDTLPFSRTTGSNLYAAVPGSRPRYLIMAHRDSKSQPVPLAYRGPAVVLGALVWLALLGTALMATAQPVSRDLVLALGVIAAVAGFILVFCYVDNLSPGALDNASGVVTAIGIAAREHEAGDVAFLITDAEELGLAGARAAARSLPAVFGVINLDGIDDGGTFRVMERFGTLRKRGLAPHLAAALLQEADATGQPADRSDVPLGIPLDHIPIVKAGTPALTLMRGTFRSLLRVHRPGDDVAHLRGDGVILAIDLVSGALRRLRDQARELER